jgi:REP element-mobilizing transposase RayT
METKYLDPKLDYNCVYHIYNCGINGCSLFHSDDDYDRFLSKYSKYIEPIADTYAWSLLGNHFHFVLKIKKEQNIESLDDLKMFEKKSGVIVDGKKPNITKQFSHLFNSYAQYYNYKYKRHGTLFERPFKRKKIENREYFKRCLIYVHQNPKRHNFVENLKDYRYTSFNYFFSDENGFIKKSTVLNFFDNMNEFEETHEKLINLDENFDNEIYD